MYKIVLAAIAALALAAPAEAKNKISRQIAVDDDFQEIPLRTSGKPPYYIMRMSILAIDGGIELCGAGVFTDGQLRDITKRILRGSYLEINGKKVIKNFSFFTKVKSRKGLKTATANCVATGVKFNGNWDSYDIEFGRDGGIYSY